VQNSVHAELVYIFFALSVLGFFRYLSEAENRNCILAEILYVGIHNKRTGKHTRLNLFENIVGMPFNQDI
jgi:hypothetical protein